MAPLFTLKRKKTDRQDKAKRILLVDDNRDHVELMSILLKKALPSCKISIEKDGEGAIRRLRTGRPDLILLDVNLPKMGGVQVLKKIKSHRQLAKIPVVICTTSTRNREVDTMLRMGADTCVVKSNMEKELKAKVGKLL